MAATPLVLDAGAVLLGIVALWLGASRFVAGASDLAARVGVPPLVVGLTVVAIGTSAPEFAVTVGAALAGRTDISVANVVGSNVINLGIVLGGAAAVRAMPTPAALARRDGPVLVGATLLVAVLVADLQLGRLEGGLLAVLLLAYIGRLAVLGIARGPDLGVDTPVPEHRPAVDALWLLGGLVAIVVGAELLVDGAVGIAGAAGLSDWLVGETVVALGTSAPEIVASVAAIRQGRLDVSAGNVFGSCVVNLLGVLGVAATVRPLTLAPVAVEATVWLCVVTGLAVLLTVTRRTLSRTEGALLLAVGVVDWLVVAILG
ncbi:sodium:calcium antiporter [Haloglomus litoreum]|uniref:sodium:calcium antiporter n=1 Tax=Haloglomus litoreum TaxID=3034026 RepID=UPI0023E8E826|nr:sodium:calcium antiporter [Haloglomus sp. DT116]